MGPIAFAFAAGMVATVNPCGFAMLPVYLSLFLTDTSSPDQSSAVTTGLRVGAIVTLAFVATFALVGGIFSFVTTGIVNLVPWAALVIGLGLLVAGVVVLAGRHLSLRTIQIRFRRDGSIRSIVVFGVAYAVASISCTLPIFLAVTAAATAGTAVNGLAVFVFYGLGMGAVLVALAVAVATSRDTVIRRMRGLMPYVERIGGWLLLASGLFIVYYWATVLTVDFTQDSLLIRPLSFVGRVSTWFTNQISSNPVLWALGLVVLVGLIYWTETRRMRKEPSDEGQDDGVPAIPG
ncbi:MAG: cytochrome c biogenesis CcdA family protein [Acidimicrobiia bacterium]